MTFKPQAVTDEQLLKQIKKDCLRLLIRREHSRKEIEQKLIVKGYKLQQISAVIDDLAKQNWQDDARFAESYVRTRSRKGFGPVKIAGELRQQGVDKDTINRLIKAHSEDWLTLVEQAYRKKFADPVIANTTERDRRIRFLSQRGFPSNMILDVIEQTSKIRT